MAVQTALCDCASESNDPSASTLDLDIPRSSRYPPGDVEVKPLSSIVGIKAYVQQPLGISRDIGRYCINQNRYMKQKLFEVLPFDSQEFYEAWTDWKEYRRSIKAPLTEIAAKRQLIFLRDLGEEKAIKSIDASINNNWTGLFEPRTFDVPATFNVQIGLWDGKKYGQ